MLSPVSQLEPALLLLLSTLIYFPPPSHLAAPMHIKSHYHDLVSVTPVMAGIFPSFFIPSFSHVHFSSSVCH